MNPRKIALEVCVDSITSALNAQLGGADRVELCDNLAEGGTTPSAGLIRVVRAQIAIGLQVMIRPRGGDFLYSPEELEAMKYDISQAKALGADGIVLGCLSPDGRVDAVQTRELISLAKPMNVTFHRAFDMVPNPFEALETLIAMGADRILTSGQERSAPEGAELIAQLVAKAGDRIIILAGGGIRPHNIQSLFDQTRIQECHVSGRRSTDSRMTYRNPRITMGSLPDAEYTRQIVDEEIIRNFRRQLM